MCDASGGGAAPATGSFQRCWARRSRRARLLMGRAGRSGLAGGEELAARAGRTGSRRSDWARRSGWDSPPDAS